MIPEGPDIDVPVEKYTPRPGEWVESIVKVNDWILDDGMAIRYDDNRFIGQMGGLDLEEVLSDEAKAQDAVKLNPGSDKRSGMDIVQKKSKSDAKILKTSGNRLSVVGSSGINPALLRSLTENQEAFK